jgi:hypothetical protein
LSCFSRWGRNLRIEVTEARVPNGRVGVGNYKVMGSCGFPGSAYIIGQVSFLC